MNTRGYLRSEVISEVPVYRVSQKSEPLNILQQQPQIWSDLNKILRTQDDICYKHYYIVSYKSAFTLLKYELFKITLPTSHEFPSQLMSVRTVI